MHRRHARSVLLLLLLPWLQVVVSGCGPAAGARHQFEELDRWERLHRRVPVLQMPEHFVAGVPFEVRVSYHDGYRRLRTDYDDLVTLGLAAAPAGASLDGERTVRAVGGVAVFQDLVIRQAGAPFRLLVTSRGAATGVGEPFRVEPSVPTVLAFATWPAAGASGTPLDPAVQVEVLDQFGNRATTDTRAVRLSVSANPGRATLAGVREVAAVEGLAQFGDLVLDRPGVGYVLLAQADGVASAESPTFDLSAESDSSLALEASAAALTAGATLDLTVTAQDAYGLPDPGYRGTVSFSSADPQALLPEDYTFTEQDAGSHSFPGAVSLYTAGAQTVIVSPVGSQDAQLAASVRVDVGPGAASALQVEGVPDPVIAGQAASVTLRVVDAWGNRVPSYTGTVAFECDDPQAALPDPVAFAAGDEGQVVLSEALVLYSAGDHTLTAVDQSDPGLSGQQAGITVRAAVARRLELAGVVSGLRTGEAATVVVTVRDAWGNTVSDYEGTLRFGSSDPLATLPGDAALTAADGGARVFEGGVVFGSTGPRSVAVWQVDDPAMRGAAAGLRVDPPGDPAPPRLDAARYALYLDVDRNGVVGAGDALILPFDRTVVPGAAGPADFAPAVAGDDWGAGATLAAGPGADELTLTLGTGAVLSPGGDWSPASAAAGSPSGLNLAAFPVPGGVQSSGGEAAEAAAALDVAPGLVEVGPLAGLDQARALALADVDADGDIDILGLATGGGSTFLQIQIQSTPSLWIINPGPDPGDAVVLALADLDADGLPELLLGGPSGLRVRAGLGGVFPAWANTGQDLPGDTVALALGDVDGDGDLDLVQAVAGAACRLWSLGVASPAGQGAGGLFEDAGELAGTEGTRVLALLDADGDGLADLVAGGADGVLRVWLHRGAGVFESTDQVLASAGAAALVAADLDGDGDLDLAAAGDLGGAGGPSSAGGRVWFHDGYGGFRDAGQALHDAGCGAAAAGDLDGDGDVDLLLGGETVRCHRFYGSVPAGGGP